MRRILLCSIPLALALTSCSGGGEDAPDPDDASEAGAEGGSEAAAQAVAEGFVASLNADDAEAACAFMDEPAQSAVIAQSEGAQDCVTAFPDYRANLPEPELIEIGEVELGTDLDGETEIATVSLTHPDEEVGALEVRESADGEWRATRVPGTTLGGA